MESFFFIKNNDSKKTEINNDGIIQKNNYTTSNRQWQRSIVVKNIQRLAANFSRVLPPPGISNYIISGHLFLD